MKMGFWAVLGIAGGLSIIYAAAVFYRKISYCPDCGKRLGPIKSNASGWEYRECGNKECSTAAIGLETLIGG